MNEIHRNRILLVDDDEQVLEPLQIALTNRGYEVLVARDGEQALISSERDDPDLIVLDVVMPKRSGFLVLDRIRKSKFRSPKIIIVTASCEQRYREFAESRGIDDFITKPYDFDLLLTRIDELMSKEHAAH
ncbi:Alkaline phosphatase synthesis transcriptional regulatory protein PhoP [Polystyrenella longa]|uniref:Alkaline phosphatase synthesis transcriptional regulatory protein PhoP n=1 Tax=Polystyrenella longa TaxID=2528007 RepID=A0A518CKH2_9PLAN|nr:response regulator [Polystyrenella longa]QDU79721.1 Alkaline phosphatase synthesis transcriptional regulatory protein PhoP [Polystyrenella longa]